MSGSSACSDRANIGREGGHAHAEPLRLAMAAQQARRMGRGAAMLAAGRAPLGRLAGSVTAWVAGPHPLWEGEAPGRRIDRFKQGKYALRRARRPSPAPHLDGVAAAVHARANQDKCAP